MSADEFQEILHEVSVRFPMLEPKEIETFSYYLLQVLGSCGALSDHDQDDYIRVIDRLRWGPSPDDYRSPSVAQPRMEPARTRTIDTDLKTDGHQ